MQNEITEREGVFIRKLYQNSSISHYGYFMVGFLFCIAVLGIIIGIYSKIRDGFLISIYFGTLSIVLFFKIRNDKKIVSILEKLMDNKK